MQQKVAAELLGYEQSYISGLECGQKNPPRKDFIKKVVIAYKLDQEEHLQLLDAVEQSRNIFRLPSSASSEAYSIFQALENQITKLGQNQIQLIKIALGLEQLNTVEGNKVTQKSDHKESEATKM